MLLLFIHLTIKKGLFTLCNHSASLGRFVVYGIYRGLPSGQVTTALGKPRPIRTTRQASADSFLITPRPCDVKRHYTGLFLGLI